MASATASALPRQMTRSASMYPTTPNIVLNGTTSDSLWFGPTPPPTGVPNMMSTSGSSGTSSSNGSGT